LTLKDLRCRVPLSQEIVARALKRDQSTISCWESGKWAPAKKIRPTLAAMYHVPLPVLERCIMETCGKDTPEDSDEA
jgi:DNA-binding transcriptional regulator YiaG